MGVIYMLTKLGKELRKIRLDRDELLKDMAQKLDVTVAYLSAVENGNRKFPDSWIGIIAEEYQLDAQEIEKLQCLAFDERDSININIQNVNKKERSLAYSFARRFNDLSEDDINELEKILKKGE